MSGSLQLPHKCTGGWGCCEGGNSLHSPWPSCTQRFLSGWHPGAHPHHTEGHHSPIWDHKYSWQERHLRALYAGPCACRASTRSPDSHLHCTNCQIWGVTPKFPPSANPSEEPECYPIVIPTKIITRKVASANQVPPVALLNGTWGESAHSPQKDWILEEFYLQGVEDWPKDEQEQARKLLVRWEHLFVCSNLDLGKMSLIKHQIKLTDWMPFKECYGWIGEYPPYVWWCEGTSPGDAGHRCHLKIAKSIG